MATTYKVLGQSAPAADTWTDVYTAPAGTQAVISTLTVCNQSLSPVAFRAAVRPGGAALAAKHYLMFDAMVDIGDTIFFTLGLTLAATDVVSIRSTSNNSISYSLFGSEIA